MGRNNLESILKSVAEVKCKLISDKITTEAQENQRESDLIRKQMMENSEVEPENEKSGKADIWETLQYYKLLEKQREIVKAENQEKNAKLEEQGKNAQEEFENFILKAMAGEISENPHNRGVDGEFRTK